MQKTSKGCPKCSECPFVFCIFTFLWKGAAQRNTKRAPKPRNNLFTEIRGPKITVTPKYDIKCFQYCTIKIIILRRLYDFIRSNA